MGVRSEGGDAVRANLAAGAHAAIEQPVPWVESYSDSEGAEGAGAEVAGAGDDVMEEAVLASKGLREDRG